jgi:Mrp family chromosome partitioning ATPase
VHEPTSASAEAFRFVAATISLQQIWPSTDDGSSHYTTLMTTSAGLSEGKTVVTANTALAAAREGRKVLVMDADFGNQQLTELMVGATTPPRGMTDVVSREVTLAKAVIPVEHEGTGTIHLLSRGHSPIKAPDFFAAPATHRMFEDIRTKYDLVLIDAPPLLRVAYATTLARLADRAMVVIAHGSEIAVAEELRDQIELVGVPPIGYVYNLAPLRAEMTVSAGSMADTLGGFPAQVVEVDVTASEGGASDVS